MTTVEILPVSDTHGGRFYRAILRGNDGANIEDKHSVGKTAGQALDALTAQMEQPEFSALLVIRNANPDGFFSAEQQERLSALMEQWRRARDQGQELSSTQQAELDALVEAELSAATARTAAFMQQGTA